MSETVKLIVEIPKSAFDLLNTTGVDWLGAEHILSAVADGLPLKRDSELAEMQAYFAGMDYGWECGRKALIEDVKEEIGQFREALAEKAPSLKDLIDAQRTVDVCLGIIDKYIGDESEGEE